MSSGGLIISNATGSATGAGSVTVEEGTLGGEGKIAGPTTIGTGTGAGGFLQPSKGANSPTALTIQNTLTFKGNSTYIWKLNTNKAKADTVIASGITIETGAQFSFNTVANKKLIAGVSSPPSVTLQRVQSAAPLPTWPITPHLLQAKTLTKLVTPAETEMI